MFTVGQQQEQDNELKKVWLTILTASLTNHGYTEALDAANEGTESYINKFINREELDEKYISQ